MADDPTKPPIERGLVPLGILKRLNDRQDLPLEQVDEFLAAVIQDAPKLPNENIRIPVPIEHEANPKDLVVRYQVRNIPNVDQREGYLFLVDIIGLLDEIRYWLQRFYYPQNEEVRNAFAQQPLNRYLSPLFIVEENKQQFLSEGLIWHGDNQANITQYAQALKNVVEILLGVSAAAPTTGNLQVLVDRINRDFYDAWGEIRTLARALQATTDYNLYVTADLVSSREDLFHAQRVRVVLDTFTLAVRRHVVENNISEGLDPAIRIVKSDELLFVPKVRDPQQRKLPIDSQTVNSFVNTHSTLIRLLRSQGVVAKPVERPAAAAGEAAEGAAALEEPTERPPQRISFEEYLEQTKEKIALKLLPRFPFEDELGTERLAQLQPALVAVIATFVFEEQLANEIKQVTYLGADNRTHPIYEESDDTVLVIDRLPAIQELIEKYERLLFEEIVDPAYFVSEVIKLAQSQTAVTQNLEAEEEKKTKEVTFDSAHVPQNLKEIVAALPPEEQPQETQRLIDWWLTQSIQERRDYLERAGLLGWHEAIVDGLTYDVIRQLASQESTSAFIKQYFERLDYQALEDVSQRHPELIARIRQAISAFLLETNSDINSLYQFDKTRRYQLWEETITTLLSQIKVDSTFEQPLHFYIAYLVEENRQKIFEPLLREFRIDGIHRNNFSYAVDAIIITSQDPLAFIQSLSEAELQTYLDIVLSSNPIERAAQLREISTNLQILLLLRQKQLNIIGLSTDFDAIKSNLPAIIELIRQVGSPAVAQGFTTSYDSALQILEQNESLITQKEKQQIAQLYLKGRPFTQIRPREEVERRVRIITPEELQPPVEAPEIIIAPLEATTLIIDPNDSIREKWEKYQKAAYKEKLIKELWQQLSQDTQANLAATLPGVTPEQVQPNIPPGAFSAVQANTLISQNPNLAVGRKPRRRVFFGRRKKDLFAGLAAPQIGKQLLSLTVDQAQKAATDTAFNLASSALSTAIPFSGALLQATYRLARFLETVTGVDWKKTFALVTGIFGAGLGALIFKAYQLFTSNLAAFLGGSAGALGGGVAGFVTGGPIGALTGAGAGWMGGTYAGYAVGEALGIPSSMGALLGGAGGLIDKLVKSPSKAAPKAAVGTTPGLGVGGGGNLITKVAVFGAAGGPTLIGLFFTMPHLRSAFLQAPLPFGGEDTSKYVKITKTASPGKKFEEPANISYAISIKPKSGYTITITDIKDEVTIANNQELNPSGEQTIPPSDSYVQFQAMAQALIGQQIAEQTTLPEYVLSFENNPGYNHSSITNTFSITFDVSGKETATNQKLRTTERICFGDCPRVRGGDCWPTQGIISQLPLKGLSHGPTGADAYDISTPIGTPIYAPIDGQVSIFTNTPTNTWYTYQEYLSGKRSKPLYSFGISVKLDGSDPNTGEAISLIFGHLQATAELGSVSKGDLIGFVGNTGFSSASHLHYEIRPGGSLGASRIETLVPDGENVDLNYIIKTDEICQP